MSNKKSTTNILEIRRKKKQSKSKEIHVDCVIFVCMQFLSAVKIEKENVKETKAKTIQIMKSLNAYACFQHTMNTVLARERAIHHITKHSHIKKNY